MTPDPAGQRGQFYKPGAGPWPLVQVDERVYDYLSGKARFKGVPVEDLVNDILKKAIELAWRLES